MPRRKKAMPKKWYDIRGAAKDDPHIYIYGDFVSEKWFDEDVTAKDFVDDLNALGDAETIHLHINSGGGVVWQAIPVYTAIRNHPARMVAHIDGRAASAATLPVLAADEAYISNMGEFMIHEPHVGLMVHGNRFDVREAADSIVERLEVVADQFASVYAESSNLSKDEILAMMKAETWLTPVQALEYGFVDGIESGLKIAAHVSDERFYLHNGVKEMPTKKKVEVLEDKDATEIKSASDETKTQDAVIPLTADDIKNMINARLSMLIEENKPLLTPPPQAAVSGDSVDIKAQLQERMKTLAELEAKCSENAKAKAIVAKARTDFSIDLDTVRTDLLDALSAGIEPIGEAKQMNIQMGRAEHDKRIEIYSKVVHKRLTHQPLEGDERQFSAVGIQALAKQSLIGTAGFHPMDVAAMTPVDVIRAAVQPTTDFPNLLMDAMHKAMVSAYEEEGSFWRAFCRISSVGDFHVHHRLLQGTMEDYDVVAEDGTIPDKAISDVDAPTIQAEVKGARIHVTFQALVNDDMQYISDRAGHAGRSGARTISKEVAAVMIAGAGTFFSGGNNNYTGVAGAITPTIDNLRAAMDQMRRRTDTAGNASLDIRPVYFVGSPINADHAIEIFGSRSFPEAGQESGRVNSLFNRINANNIIDTAYLTDKEWWLVASPSVAPMVEIVFLNGQQTPTLEEVPVSDKFNFLWKSMLPYKAGLIDNRGGHMAQDTT